MSLSLLSRFFAHVLDSHSAGDNVLLRFVITNFLLFHFVFNPQEIDPTRSVKHKINFAWPSLYWKSPINCHAVACADKVVHIPL